MRVSKLFEGFIAVVEDKSLVRRSVTQLGSAVGIDVVHHMVNVRLCESVKGRSFWQDPTHKLMVYLNRTLLVRECFLTSLEIVERSFPRTFAISPNDFPLKRQFSTSILSSYVI